MFSHVMVGVNGEGLISAVSIPFQEYTEGSDAKVAEDAFLSIFVGRSVPSGTTIEEDYELDPVPGAEEASDAVYQSVKAALRQYMMMENIEKNDQMMTLERQTVNGYSLNLYLCHKVCDPRRKAE